MLVGEHLKAFRGEVDRRTAAPAGLGFGTECYRGMQDRWLAPDLSAASAAATVAAAAAAAAMGGLVYIVQKQSLAMHLSGACLS